MRCDWNADARVVRVLDDVLRDGRDANLVRPVNAPDSRDAMELE